MCSSPGFDAAVRQELGQTFLLIETRAGLAQVALAQGKLGQAVAQVEMILPELNPESMTGTEEPMRIYLACYQVLAAVGHDRAGNILAEANQLIRERAAKIAESKLRQMFLQVIPVHHALLTAYQQHTSSSDG